MEVINKSNNKLLVKFKVRSSILAIWILLKITSMIWMGEKLKITITPIQNWTKLKLMTISSLI